MVGPVRGWAGSSGEQCVAGANAGACRGYEPTVTTGAGECSSDGSEQNSVVITEFRSIDLSAQHAKLVA